jgi:hypothetical protein
MKASLPLFAITLTYFCCFGHVSGAQYSALWGENGELWDPADSQLRDFTNVGYKGGDVPIPDWPIGVNILDFGAIPDDGQEDSQAIIDAIAACPDFHAVFIPKGRYVITQQIKPERSHFVLRGEDMYESVLFFPKNLSEIYLYKIGYPEGRVKNASDDYGFLQMDGGEEKSIENLSFEFREQRKGGIWEYLGANPIWYKNVSNSWVRNVYVKNYDLGPYFGGNNISVINMVLDHFIGRRSLPQGPKVFDACFGPMIRNSNHNLFHNIWVGGIVMQPIDMNDASSSHVFSQVRSQTTAVSFHGGGTRHILFTDMRNSMPEGFTDNRHVNDTIWGVRSDAEIRPGTVISDIAYASTNNHVFVGWGDGRPEKINDEIWYEPIAGDQLSPSNIYLAQLEYFNEPLPEPLPRAIPSPYEGAVVRVIATKNRRPAGDINPGLLQTQGSYLQFDMTEISVPELAHARLRLNLVSLNDTPIQMSVWKVLDDDWSEVTLGADMPLPVAELDFQWIEDGETNLAVEFDITEFAREQLVDGDGILSFYIDRPQGGFQTWFRGKHIGNAPMLIIERTPSAVPGAPSAPKGIRSTPLVGNIRLDWDDNPESDVATYNVYRSPFNDYSDSFRESIASGLTTSDFVDVQSTEVWGVGMMDHKLVYHYLITAVDDHGYESPRSLEFVAATKHPSNDPPVFAEAASLPNATARRLYEENLGTLTSDPESDQMYFMKVSGPDWLQVALDGSLSGMPDLSNAGNNEFTFQVTAIGGSTQQAFDLYVDLPVDSPVGAPAAPANLDASLRDRTVTLSWDGSPEADLFGYSLYRSISAGTLGHVLAVDLDTTTYVDTNVNYWTTYYYTLTASDTNYNESATSNVVSVTPVVGTASVIEPFNYAVGNLAGPATGSGLMGDWSARPAMQIGSGSLPGIPGYGITPTGNCFTYAANGWGRATVNLSPESSIDLDVDNTVYFSFLANFGDARGVFQVIFNDTTTDAHTAAAGDVNGARLNVKLGARGDTSFASPNLPADTTVLVVGKFETFADASISDTLRASVFTNLADGEPTEWDTVQSTLGISGVVFNQLEIFGSGNDGTINYRLDEFRMGATFASVVTEAGALDSDGDGLADTIEMEYFGSLAHSDGTVDSDADGVLDFFEYMYGSALNDASDKGFFFHMAQSRDGSKSPSVEWSVLRGLMPGYAYDVMISTDLTRWDPLPAAHYTLSQTHHDQRTNMRLEITHDYGDSVFIRLKKR